MKNLLLFFLAFLGFAFAAKAPTSVAESQIAWPTIGAPYLVVVGTDGRTHPVTGVNVTSVGGVYTLALPVAAPFVFGEVPAVTAGGWSLLRAPVNGASCYRNGLYQAPGLDYALSGASITSSFWQADDNLFCNYQ